MARTVVADDLISSLDAADLLGVTRSAVSNWKVHYQDFPMPVATIARGQIEILSRREVLAWAARHHKI